jgi:hypothetical protein
VFDLQECLRSVVQQALKFLKTYDLSGVDDVTSVTFVCPIAIAHVKEQLAK